MMNFQDYTNECLLTYLKDLYNGKYQFYMNEDEFNEIKMLQRQLSEMPEGFNTRENLVRLIGEEAFDIFSTYSRVLDSGIDGLILEAIVFIQAVTDRRYVSQINDILDEKNTKKTELELRKIRVRFNEDMDDIFYRIRHDIYGNPNRRQLEESSAQFYKKYKPRVERHNDGIHVIPQVRQFDNEQLIRERRYITALLLNHPRAEGFFTRYAKNDYLEFKKLAFDFIRDRRFYQIVKKLEEIENRLRIQSYNKIFGQIFRPICVTPGTYIKFLPEKDRDGYYNIRQNCCLEFGLKHFKDNQGKNKTILTMFFDTYDSVVGGRFKIGSNGYKCNNVIRHKIADFSCEGIRSLDRILSSQNTVRHIVTELKNRCQYPIPELFRFLQERRINIARNMPQIEQNDGIVLQEIQGIQQEIQNDVVRDINLENDISRRIEAFNTVGDIIPQVHAENRLYKMHDAFMPKDRISVKDNNSYMQYTQIKKASEYMNQTLRQSFGFEDLQHDNSRFENFFRLDM